MTLDQYRRAHGLSFPQLAEMLGVKGAGAARTVQRYAKFERIPGRVMMRRIESLTNGDVTSADFPDRSLSVRGAVEDVSEPEGEAA